MKSIPPADKRATSRVPSDRLPAVTGKDRNAAELLRTRTAELTERIKELNCLYGISNLFETQGVSLPWILQRAVELIPAAWQYPELEHPETVIGKSVFALKSGAIADIRTIFGSLQSDDRFEKTETVLSFSRNGRTCWYQICHSPITFKGLPAILSTFKDVSEIKAQEIAASRKAENLQRENLALKSTLKDRYRFSKIVRCSGTPHKANKRAGSE